MNCVLFIGWKGTGSQDVPKSIYCGQSVVDGLKAVAATGGQGFVRIQKFVNPMGIPIALPDALPAAEVAAQSHKKSAK